MTEHIFAHTIGRADLIGGVIRCELNTMVPGEHGAEQPQALVNHALIMPVDGFLRAFATLEDLVRKLVAAGIIRPQEKRSETGAGADKAMTLPKSPNFS